jgi:hypothetical protein
VYGIGISISAGFEFLLLGHYCPRHGQGNNPISCILRNEKTKKKIKTNGNSQESREKFKKKFDSLFFRLFFELSSIFIKIILSI